MRKVCVILVGGRNVTGATQAMKGGGKVTRQGREADDSSWHIAPESPHGALAALNQVLGDFLTTQHVLILPSINSVNAVVPPNLLGYQLLT